MSAFLIGSSALLSCQINGSQKRIVFKATGPATYNTGGSVLDLTDTDLGKGVMTRVDGVRCIGVEAAGSAAFNLTYKRASAGAPSTGTVIAYTGGTQAQVADTNAGLDGLVFLFEAVGA